MHRITGVNLGPPLRPVESASTVAALHCGRLDRLRALGAYSGACDGAGRNCAGRLRIDGHEKRTTRPRRNQVGPDTRRLRRRSLRIDV
jgi:hypothetical protein